MKIAFAIADLQTGGIERVVVNLSNELVKKGYDVTIIATKSGQTGYRISPQIYYYTLTHDSAKGRGMRVFIKIRELRKIVTKEKFDILLSFGAYVTMYSVFGTAFTKTKLIGAERTDPSKAPEQKILRWIRNWAYRYTDTMVFQTEMAKEYFSPPIQNKGRVIPNPIKNDLPQRWQGKRDHEVVNFCRLNRQKNLKLLYQAFARFHKFFPDYKMMIWGEGEQKDELNRLAQSLKIENHVKIHPFTADIHQKILKSRMFVSSSDYEGISNSMLEALGMGLTCICTDCPVGGARMFIKNNVNGILVPTGDEDALTAAMLKVASHEDEADKMGCEAVSIRQTISLDVITDNWLQVINDTIESRKG